MTIDKLPLNKLKTLNETTAALNTIGASNNDANIDISIFTGFDSAKFTEMVNKSKVGNTADSIFFQNIDSIGAENFFAALDKNNDGTIQEDEIKEVAGLDGDAKGLSSLELKVVLYDILSKALSVLKIDNEVINDKVQSLLPTGQDYYEMPAANGYNPEPKQPTTQEKATTLAKDEIPALENKKKEIIQTADKNIQEQDKLMNDTIQQSSKVSTELKEQYTTLNTSLTDLNTQIQGADGEITACDSSKFTLDSSIAALEGEQSTLNTSTKDEKINQQNSARKNEISGQLTSKKSEKTKLEDKKKELQTKKQELETQKTDVEQKLAKVTEQIELADPEIKTKIDAIKEKISALKTAKDKDVADVDAQIETKRAEAIKYQKESGEQVGKASEGLGSDIIQNALQYEGMNEADGSFKKFTNGRDEAWCADFVSYVVKETYEKNGKELPKGFGSPSVSNLRQWGKDNGCYTQTSNIDGSAKASYMAKNVKAGDIIIFADNGSSHTGLVESVEANGTIHTVEGNTSDKVAKRTYDPNKNTISGFVQLDKYKDS